MNELRTYADPAQPLPTLTPFGRDR
jgi:hypothetical protein